MTAPQAFANILIALGYDKKRLSEKAHITTKRAEKLLSGTALIRFHEFMDICDCVGIRPGAVVNAANAVEVA